MRVAIMWFFALLPFIVVIAISAAIIYRDVQHDNAVARWRTNCATDGGHIYQADTDEALFCLSADGRMLEVYP